MSEKLNKYVKKELDNGSSREKVLDTLTSAGWEKEEVIKALNEVLNVGEATSVDEEAEEESGRSEKVRLFLLALTIFIMGLMIIGVVVGFMYLNPEMLF